ncbi:MAG: 4Fe-4S dicluster domain [Sporomusa sp.]|jgi:Fe-S-cluster-containing hydrogenase component 2|nr:4Fe-4S dicluster domain [Sporomusa sp.]
MEQDMFFLVGDGEKCKQCLACQLACPNGDIKFVPFKYKHGRLSCFDTNGIAYHDRMCSDCLGFKKQPPCVDTCPEQALTIVNMRQERKTKNQQAVTHFYKYWGGRERV